MTTPTLPDIGIEPDYGLQQGGEFRVQAVSFGDGYQQRRPDGINSTTRSWKLKWSNLDKSQRDTLVDFLEAQKGAYSFIWQVPDSDLAYKVTCPGYPSWSVDDYGSYTVTASFKEDFSP